MCFFYLAANELEAEKGDWSKHINRFASRKFNIKMPKVVYDLAVQENSVFENNLYVNFVLFIIL